MNVEREKILNFIRALFSFETVVVLWIFSYQYKNASSIFDFPDITILLTLILIPWGLVLYIKNKSKSSIRFLDNPNLAFMALSFWFILSSFWSASHDYKLQKTACYAFYTIPGFLMGYLIIAQDERRIKRLLQAFFIFSIVVLIECFRVFWLKGLLRISDIMNTNYLVTGQTLGTGLLVLIPLSRLSLEHGFQKLNWRLLSLPLSGLFLYALINLGGRGPVISAIVALGFFYGMDSFYKSPSKAFLHLTGLIVCFSLTYGLLNWFFDHTGCHFGARLTPVLQSLHIDESLNERFSYYHSALQAFLQHPLLGVGLGGWPVFHGLGDVELHPHNIFLEILSETGLIGLILFLTMLSLSFRHLKLPFIFSNPYSTSVILITLFSFMNALKSGDLHDNLLLFFSISLAAGLQTHQKN